MPRYRFRFNDQGGGVSVSLDGVAEARGTAIRMFIQMLNDAPERLSFDREMKLEVADDKGLILMVFHIDPPPLKWSIPMYGFRAWRMDRWEDDRSPRRL